MVKSVKDQSPQGESLIDVIKTLGPPDVLVDQIEYATGESIKQEEEMIDPEKRDKGEPNE